MVGSVFTFSSALSKSLRPSTYACLLCMGLSPLSHGAPIDVTAVHVGGFVDGADSTVNGITYQAQELPILSLESAGTEWVLGGFPTTLHLRRSGSGDAPGREVVWSERPSASPQTTVRAPEPSTTEAALNTNNLFGAPF